jgi:hypothetical protein
MFYQSFLAAPRFPEWLSFRKKGHGADPASHLLKRIEREFLYRGTPLLAVKAITISPNSTAVNVEIIARPLYQDDSRLKYKSWAQLFTEQVFEDAAKVLWTIWNSHPTLEHISLQMYRRLLDDLAATDGPILSVRAAGADLRTKVLQWKKHAPFALLQQCEIAYELDPRLGLRPLHDLERWNS